MITIKQLLTTMNIRAHILVRNENGSVSEYDVFNLLHGGKKDYMLQAIVEDIAVVDGKISVYLFY